MKKPFSILAATMMLGGLFGSSSVFAANSYNINYTGGEALGTSNVTVNASLINGLTYLQPSGGDYSVEFSNNTAWKSGYIDGGGAGCLGVKYFTVRSTEDLKNKGFSFTINRDSYKSVFTFEKVELEGFDGLGADEYVPIIVSTSGTNFNSKVYADRNEEGVCENPVVGLVNANLTDQSRVFEQMNVKLYGKDGKLVKSDQLYMRISDIDAGQSYKIMNSDSLLGKNTTFVKSITALTPSDTTLRNMYVANGNYIYAQYDQETEKSFDIENDGDLFVKMGDTAQNNGLNIVLGFSSSAASSLRYYVQFYTVNYQSDEYGEITGIKNESLMSGNLAAGTTEKAKDGYELKRWIASVDVMLKKNCVLDGGTSDGGLEVAKCDGKTYPIDEVMIKAGKAITTEQLKKVVVDSDVTFTAIHEEAKEEGPATPNTGIMTGSMNAGMIAAPIAGILLGGLVLYLSPRLFHKKMNFKK